MSRNSNDVREEMVLASVASLDTPGLEKLIEAIKTDIDNTVHAMDKYDEGAELAAKEKFKEKVLEVDNNIIDRIATTKPQDNELFIEGSKQDGTKCYFTESSIKTGLDREKSILRQTNAKAQKEVDSGKGISLNTQEQINTSKQTIKTLKTMEAQFKPVSDIHLDKELGEYVETLDYKVKVLQKELRTRREADKNTPANPTSSSPRVVSGASQGLLPASPLHRDKTSPISASNAFRLPGVRSPSPGTSQLASPKSLAQKILFKKN